MPKVSVIVPAYNVERYFRQCLDSLVSQTLDDLQIVIVNDGATDSTPQIAREYAARHSNIILHEKPNGGLSSARNAGLPFCQGDYIGYIDSDDWVGDDMFRAMYERAAQTEADLVIANGQRFNEPLNKLEPLWDDVEWKSLVKRVGSRAFTLQDQPRTLLLEPMVWRKLFRRSFLERLNLRFPEGLLYEDQPSHFESILSAGSIALVDRPLIYYRVNRPGQVTMITDTRLLMILKIFNLIDDVMERHKASDLLWAMCMKFQLRNVVWISNVVSEELVRHLLIGFRHNLSRKPPAAIALFEELFPMDRFSLRCAQQDWVGRFSRYAHAKFDPRTKMYLLSHSRMWPLFAQLIREKSKGLVSPSRRTP